MRKTAYRFRYQIGLEIQKPCRVVSAGLTDLKLHIGQTAKTGNVCT